MPAFRQPMISKTPGRISTYCQIGTNVLEGLNSSVGSVLGLLSCLMQSRGFSPPLRRIFLVDGIFPWEIIWVLPPFLRNSFGWEYKPRSSLCTHAFHCTGSKDIDVHVLDRWMPATKHTQHAPSTKTECDYFYGWIKKTYRGKSLWKKSDAREITDEDYHALDMLRTHVQHWTSVTCRRNSLSLEQNKIVHTLSLTYPCISYGSLIPASLEKWWYWWQYFTSEWKTVVLSILMWHVMLLTRILFLCAEASESVETHIYPHYKVTWACQSAMARNDHKSTSLTQTRSWQINYTSFISVHMHYHIYYDYFSLHTPHSQQNNQ